MTKTQQIKNQNNNGLTSQARF